RVGKLDIEYIAKITHAQSETGCELMIPTLENDPISLTYEDEITDDIVEVFSGRGLPAVGNKRSRGNLVVRFQIVPEVDPKDVQIYERFEEDKQLIVVHRENVQQQSGQESGNVENGQGLQVIPWEIDKNQPGTNARSGSGSS